MVKTSMKKLFLFAAILCVTFGFYTLAAQAQEAKGIVVTPKRIVFDKEDKILEVLIANRGNTEGKFRISLINRAMTEDGQLQDAETPAAGEFFASDVVRYSPRQVTLAPKETQKIRLMSRLRNDAPDGEYRSHLLIQEVPDAEGATSANAQATTQSGLGINVRAIFGMSLPVILRKGNLSADVKLSAPEIVTENNEKFLKVTIERSGTKSVMGTVNVFTGQEKIATLKNVAIYMSTPRRVVFIKLGSEHAQQLSGKSLRITYGAEEENEDAPQTETSFTAK